MRVCSSWVDALLLHLPEKIGNLLLDAEKFRANQYTNDENWALMATIYSMCVRRAAAFCRVVHSVVQLFNEIMDCLLERHAVVLTTSGARQRQLSTDGTPIGVRILLKWH